MNSCIFLASFEFAFAAILFVFHQSQDLVPRSSHSLSWPPFWINFHFPWTNRSRDFCCVPGSSLLPPPYWKDRRPWGRGWSKKIFLQAALFAWRPNCKGDSFPVLCRDYHDRSHDLIGLHITLRPRTCSQERTWLQWCTPFPSPNSASALLASPEDFFFRTFRHKLRRMVLG